jgi:citrate lyase subunit beta / citryl-CoA lyase
MRSWLFVPGDDQRKLDKAFASGADALIIDLEDSVASSRKDTARKITAEFMSAHSNTIAKAPALFVRINSLNSIEAIHDIEAIMKAAPIGIVLPKSQGGPDIQQLGVKLAVSEAQNNLADGSTKVMAIATETAKSLFSMGSYAKCSHRLIGIAWGGEDLAADIGAESNKTITGDYADPYRLARSLTLIGAASAEIMAIDSVFTNFKDQNGLSQETEAGRRDGFSGKMAIHPAQVPIINAVYTPSVKAIAKAQAIIAAFAANPDAGVIGLDGEMIDKPHLRQAQRIMARVV